MKNANNTEYDSEVDPPPSDKNDSFKFQEHLRLGGSDGTAGMHLDLLCQVMSDQYFFGFIFSGL